MSNVFEQALKEMQPVREMTVEEVAQIINQEDCWDGAYAAAQSLAKLGCIRIVGEV